MKLISMTDFVLEQKQKKTSNLVIITKILNSIFNYCNFLKQPLELWMFVPCDENNNILEKSCDTIVKGCRDCACREYQKAKERCLFEGLDEIDAETFMSCEDCKTVEDLIIFGLELTKIVEKQIGL